MQTDQRSRRRSAGSAADRAGGPRRAGVAVRVRDRRGAPARGPRPLAAAIGGDDAKQLSELQHELETLQRRQSSLEDSLLEVMERREQLQAQQDREQADRRRHWQADLADAQQARDDDAGRDRPATACPLGAARRTRRRAGSASWWRCTNVSGPAAARERACCRVAAVGRAGSRSTAASWPGSPRRPTTTCCGAPSAAQSCCGSKASSQ